MTSVVLLLFVVAISGIAVQQQAYGIWEFGSFQPGDLFVYDVCDDTTKDEYIGTFRPCYSLELLIVDRARTGFGPAWIVQADMTSSEEDDSWTASDVVLIDDSFNIHGYSERYVSSSLASTIFWINHDAKIRSFDPQLGGTVPHTSPYFDDSGVIVQDRITHDDYTEYMLDFSGDRMHGTLKIHDDVPLPSMASVFVTGKAENNSYDDDARMFWFELVSMTARSSSWGGYGDDIILPASPDEFVLSDDEVPFLIDDDDVVAEVDLLADQDDIPAKIPDYFEQDTEEFVTTSASDLPEMVQNDTGFEDNDVMPELEVTASFEGINDTQTTLETADFDPVNDNEDMTGDNPLDAILPFFEQIFSELSSLLLS